MGQNTLSSASQLHIQVEIVLLMDDKNRVAMKPHLQVETAKMRSSLFAGNLLETVLKSRRNHHHIFPRFLSPKTKDPSQLATLFLHAQKQIVVSCAFPSHQFHHDPSRILTHTPASFQTPIQKECN